jgi:hypothetical protein
MFSIAGHEISLETVITWLGAGGGFLISLGYFKARFDRMCNDIEKLREHVDLFSVKTDGEFKIMSDRSADWREKAIGRFATREELANANGIAKAIREIGDRFADALRGR